MNHAIRPTLSGNLPVCGATTGTMTVGGVTCPDCLTLLNAETDLTESLGTLTATPTTEEHMPTPLPKCDNEHCQGHLGKFDSCIAEALYVMDADETTGDVAFLGHLSVHNITEPAGHTFIDLDVPLAVVIPMGTYHLTENDQGSVTLHTYILNDPDAKAHFTEFDGAYAAWGEAP